MPAWISHRYLGLRCGSTAVMFYLGIIWKYSGGLRLGMREELGTAGMIYWGWCGWRCCSGRTRMGILRMIGICLLLNLLHSTLSICAHMHCISINWKTLIEHTSTHYMQED